MGNGTGSSHRVAQIIVKIDGTELEEAIMDDVLSVEVEQTKYYPSMFTIRYADPWVERDSVFAFGNEVEISIPNPDNPSSTTVLMKGDVTAIEPEFGRGSSSLVYTIRGFDKLYKLNRQTIYKTWIEQTHSDIVSQIAGNVGLTAEVESTTEVFETLIQPHMTDLEFLQEIAKRNECMFWVADNKLYFKKPAITGSAIDFAWGEDIYEFRPSISIAKQVDKVEVMGWNPETKQAIVGQATSSQNNTEIQSSSGGSAATSAVSAATHVVVNRNVQSQADADNVAKSVLNKINYEYIEAEGVVKGNENLRAGGVINLSNLGAKYNGKYLVTSTRHVYERGEYETHFTVEGGKSHGISDLITNAGGDFDASSANRWHGAYIAVVTNNDDPDKDWGRVKLMYPWLGDSEESGWARVAMPGAGVERGMYWLPEVNDEVLVVFEHGDLNYPVVIGGLWNGSDVPPAALADTVIDGNVSRRIMKSRTGHVIEMVESSSESHIFIFDGENKTTLKLDKQNEVVKITSTGNVEIEAAGDVSITADGAINMTATGDLSLEGNNVNVTASAAMKVEGSASAELKSGGSTTVKGSTVLIN